jgi:hypothetical protein
MGIRPSRLMGLEAFMSQRAFYLDRAAASRAEAEASSLANVRERCLRSEAAWMAMAIRAERTDKARGDAARTKAAANTKSDGTMPVTD